MGRKRLTQLFPWLLPIRKKQRIFCFYLKMRLDGRRYARVQEESLFPCQLFQSSCPMYNRQTGFDIRYQENKAFNLRLAAKTLDKLVIRPHETFSFWQRVRFADRETPYKDGLVEVDGKLTAQRGGGLCQMSNLLFWLFLHTPLTVLERTGHGVKVFPEPPSDAPMGVDATVSEGWLDLKVRNDTDTAFQIAVSFDREHIVGRIFAQKDLGMRCRVRNGPPLYYGKGNLVFEEVDVIQETWDAACGEQICAKTLYRNKCRIEYPLPEGTLVIKRG